MKNVDVVIGANFGDEGKGVTTDYLVVNKPEIPLVVRFNGGAQAGHTVQISSPAGERRHVFSHFGSGTLRGAPTFLAKDFIVNPILFLKEYETLKDVSPKVYASKHCLVTTPYDMMINQFVEEERKQYRHGSCGVGINETVTRSSNERFKLTVDDLANSTRNQIIGKLTDIKNNYVFNRLLTLGYPMVYEKYKSVFESEDIPIRFIQDINEFLTRVYGISDVNGVENIFLKYENVIFEGAQGLLLDEHHHWFPHVTRSRTGMTNVTKILKDLNFTGSVHTYYTTRTYLTRHGEGPLPGEVGWKMLNGTNLDPLDKTNIPNRYQGALRFAPYNFSLFHSAVFKDFHTAVKDGIDVIPHVSITCLDQYMNGLVPKPQQSTGDFEKHTISFTANNHAPLEQVLRDIRKVAELKPGGEKRVLTFSGPTANYGIQ